MLCGLHKHPPGISHPNQGFVYRSVVEVPVRSTSSEFNQVSSRHKLGSEQIAVERRTFHTRTEHVYLSIFSVYQLPNPPRQLRTSITAAPTLLDRTFVATPRKRFHNVSYCALYPLVHRGKGRTASTPCLCTGLRVSLER